MADDWDGFDELLASGRVPDGLVAFVSQWATQAGDSPLVRDSLRGTLAGYLDHPEWTPRFEQALAAPDPATAAKELAAALTSDGADETALITWLNGYHLDLMSQRRDADDDTVTDLLDVLTGW